MRNLWYESKKNEVLKIKTSFFYFVKVSYPAKKRNKFKDKFECIALQHLKSELH